MLLCERGAVCETSADIHRIMPGTACLCHDIYCNGNRFACARFRAYEWLTAAEVPDDLKPHEHARLKELL